MPEIFNEDAADSLKAVQRVVNDAINELHAFSQHRTRTNRTREAAWMADVRTKAAANGVDLTDWLGNKRPEDR